ncbi:MAG: beta-lactamase family protein [Gemmatimonadota bacterium]|nr:MAG: beta-lactamase family protein [Gemmatimonadota bacterium]
MQRSKFQLTIVLLVILYAISGSFALASETEPVIDDPDVKAAIEVFDAWVQHRLYQEEIPGMSVGIVYDQELMWAKGYGYANLERKTPATPSTAYRIASLTKLFTATAILHLRDAGKLQLDDPVAKHLDWFHLHDEYSDSPVITIRHLLTHSSGLPREFEALYWDDMEFPDRETLIKMFQESSTILPRESKFKYSNVAFNVLGFVVEAVSGQSYAKYVTNHILNPLGMTSTSVTPSSEMSHLATGYYSRRPGRSREIAPFFDKKAAVASGNMASTVEDLAKFLSLQFRDGAAGGAQILKGSTLKEMHRPHWLYDDWNGGRGLGWGVARVSDQVRIQHGGSVPGFKSAISAAPADKFGVVVLTNGDDGKPGEITAQAWTLIAPVVRKATETEEKPAQADPSWMRFVGAYEWSDGSVMHVMLLNNELSLVDPASDDPWGDRVRLKYVSGNTFKMLDQWQEGELIRFEENDDREVSGIIMPGYSLQRRR